MPGSLLCPTLCDAFLLIVVRPVLRRPDVLHCSTSSARAQHCTLFVSSACIVAPWLDSRSGQAMASVVLSASSQLRLAVLFSRRWLLVSA